MFVLLSFKSMVQRSTVPRTKFATHATHFSMPISSAKHVPACQLLRDVLVHAFTSHVGLSACTRHAEVCLCIWAPKSDMQLGRLWIGTQVELPHQPYHHASLSSAGTSVRRRFQNQGVGLPSASDLQSQRWGPEFRASYLAKCLVHVTVAEIVRIPSACNDIAVDIALHDGWTPDSDSGGAHAGARRVAAKTLKRFLA